MTTHQSQNNDAGKTAMLIFRDEGVDWAQLADACAIAGESPHAEFGGLTEVRMLGNFPKP